MDPLVAPIKGRLLVATPPLVDPHFDRSVVFVVEHRSDGSLGVILNRPTDEPITAPLDRWVHLLRPHPVLFEGGPVEPDALVALATTVGPVAGTTPVTDSIASVDLADDPTMVADRVGATRIFRGYASWGPGQLEHEIGTGAWITVDASPDDIVSDTPTELWRTVLRRQSGRLAWLAGAPRDLELN